jgi:hypothetical protein
MYIMLNRRSLIAIAVAGSALAGSNAFAQDQATVGIQTQTNYSIDGSITAVDPTARTVTITAADGAARTLNVSPAAANLASTKVGDNVSLNVEDTRTFVLSSPNVKTPQAGSATVGAAVGAGQNMTGAAVTQSITNWWVTAVNPAANTITLVSPHSGPIRTYNVTNPASQQQLSRVNPGDSLTDINSRIVVVSITPKS